MKIGIYDPYLDSLGGGERYALTLAEFLSTRNEVEIFWNNSQIKDTIEERLNIKIDRIRFTKNIFRQTKNLFSKLSATKEYDWIFFLSDGSIPSVFSKHGILHFQVPFTKINGRTLGNKLKLSRFKYVVCNSQFTKKFIDKTYGVESLVIYPPVDIKNFNTQEKKNIILSVGRFSKTLHSKKQEVLLSAFRELEPKIRSWELILSGGSMPDDLPYIENLKKEARGLRIKILPNIPFSDLRKLYSQAKIYWHAAGFDEDESANPERMEHFGLTTVEAMAAGCVPIVFSGGGQKEIVTDGINGFLWKTTEELKKKTLLMIENKGSYEQISQAAQKRSADFSQEKFYEAFSEIIYQ